MKVCVFSASSSNINEKYMNENRKLGEKLAESGHSLCFGGANTGSMGSSAQGFLSRRQDVVSVVPSFMIENGVEVSSCTYEVVTRDMRDRKKFMEDYSDVFIVSPGGIGTLEEFFECLTLKKLHQINKEIILFNFEDFYTPLINWLKGLAENKFMSEQSLKNFVILNTTDEIVGYINSRE